MYGMWAETVGVAGLRAWLSVSWFLLRDGADAQHGVCCGLVSVHHTPVLYQSS